MTDIITQYKWAKIDSNKSRNCQIIAWYLSIENCKELLVLLLACVGSYLWGASLSLKYYYAIIIIIQIIQRTLEGGKSSQKRDLEWSWEYKERRAPSCLDGRGDLETHCTHLDDGRASWPSRSRTTGCIVASCPFSSSHTSPSPGLLTSFLISRERFVWEDSMCF